MDVGAPEPDADIRWFEWYMNQIDSNSVQSAEGQIGPFRCPCCGWMTLPARGDYDICPVCFWEDDGQDDHDAATVRGGPNGAISLKDARANYRRFGACEKRFINNVRPPSADEQRQESL
jgi:hypothetical protein